MKFEFTKIEIRLHEKFKLNIVGFLGKFYFNSPIRIENSWKSNSRKSKFDFTSFEIVNLWNSRFYFIFQICLDNMSMQVLWFSYGLEIYSHQRHDGSQKVLGHISTFDSSRIKIGGSRRRWRITSCLLKVLKYLNF